MKRTVFVFAAVLLPSILHADLAIEILEHPKSIFVLQPAYVTYQVTNLGALPEVIPIGECPDHGFSLEVGADGGEYRPILTMSHCTYRLYRLDPGERYLGRDQQTLFAEGVIEVRAFARSVGPCQDVPGRGETLGAEPLPPMIPEGQLFSELQSYSCWQGEVYSDPVTIDVVVPQSEQDEGVRRWLGDPPEEMVRHWQELRERFPESQYTYAVHFYIGGGHRAMEAAMELQPDNPLNADVLGDWAFRVLSCTTPCVEKPCAEPLSGRVADLPVSGPVKAWLEQERSRMLEECPEIVGRRERLRRDREERE